MQRILDDLHVFVEMTEAITSELDLDRVLQSVTDAGTRLSGARFGAFFYRVTGEDGGPDRLRVTSGAGAEQVSHLPADRLAELFASTFDGSGTVRVDDAGAEAHRAVTRAGQVPLLSYLGTPVVARSGEVIGALLFGHPATGRFDERSEDVVRLVAAQAAVAVENARSYAEEQLARRAAEQSAGRLALLQTITSRLARADDQEQVLLAVLESLVGPLGASRVGVYLRDGAVYRSVAGVAPDPSTAATVAQQPQHTEFAVDGDNPVAACLADRRPLVHTSVADLAGRFPQVGARVTGMEASVLLPLVVGEQALGVLALAWREPRAFEEVELAWLGSAAEQLALALRQVALRESEAAAQAALRDSAAYAIAVSQTLQRSLLPPALPVVDALAVAVRYVPSTVDAEVGGDWYDVIATPDGGVVLVIGDVQGHSITAAAVMGQLRVALNAYLVEGHPPHVALSRVNRVMQTLRTEAIATCCLLHIDPATGHVTVVRAGHTLPLVWHADGQVTELESDGGIPLGVLPEWEWPSSEMNLAAGDRLLLYTDGLVEVPGADVDDGVAELVRAVAATGAVPRAEPGRASRRQARLEDDVDAVLRTVGVRSRDDVAVLVCEYAGPTATYRREELHVASITEVTHARALGRRTLAAWGLPHLEDSVSLLVTEMVTNALVHSGGPARLELRRHEGAVRVMVTDSSSRVPRPRPIEESATGGRGLLVVGALSMGWGVEPSGEGKTVWADVKA